MSTLIKALWRYPVKGLSPESLTSVELAAGGSFPGDRRFAVALGSAPVDPVSPEWAPKKHFLVLARHPRLAALTTRWDEQAEVLTIERDGREVAKAALAKPHGRSRLEDFLAAFVKDDTAGALKVVEASGFTYTDVPEPLVSIISTGSLRDLERVAGAPVDARRFRANVLIEGAEPWAEFAWVGRKVRLGGAVLEVVQRITRCKATCADPDTGSDAMNVPRLLRGGFGHIDFGIYARVVSGGELAAGDEVALLDD